MNRGLVRLFKYFGLLGCGLSAVGLVLAVALRIDSVLNPPVFPAIGPWNPPNKALHILDAFKEPGALLLISALLYVACEIALQLSRRSSDLAADEHD
jgi:hypothetical protein